MGGALRVAKADFLLHRLIVALDAPAQHGLPDEDGQPGVGGQCGKPVCGRLRLARRPFDQAPFFRPWRRPVVVAMRGTHADGGEA